ncbi:MAG: YicC/YloC family endoribonuclease [bacterium]|nr:YicC/YloC family endoribonuclease [bacterium]
MSRSMTGFGRGEAGSPERLWVAEIRTVNHRFLDQKINLPRAFPGFEEPVRRMVAERLGRGRVEVQLSVSGAMAGQARLAVNQDLARQYHSCLQTLQRDFALEGGIRLADMLNLRDLISVDEQPPDLETEWALAGSALSAALSACEAMRLQEGQALKEDLSRRLQAFSALVDRIHNQLPDLLRMRQAELQDRLAKLLSGIDLDPMRLAQECAIMADKSDVSEEITRLRSHINQFHSFLGLDEAVGRRLDFLLQEFLREVNTLCSKISHAEIAQLGVEMKNEIEKLREQVQNIE